MPRRSPAASILIAACSLAATAAPEHATVEPPGENLRASFDATRDFEFNFDQPAFYSLLEELRQAAQPVDCAKARFVEDWQELIERPRDLRGSVVRISGQLGRNKDPYHLASHPELGALTQLELTHTSNPVTATVICTQDVGDLPLGATVEFCGYFVMVRSYYTADRRTAHSVVVVAPGPLSVSQPAPRSNAEQATVLGWIAAAFLAALATTWIILRRANRPPHANPADLRATSAAPFSLADDLAKLSNPVAISPDDGTKQHDH